MLYVYVHKRNGFHDDDVMLPYIVVGVLKGTEQEGQVDSDTRAWYDPSRLFDTLAQCIGSQSVRALTVVLPTISPSRPYATVSVSRDIGVHAYDDKQYTRPGWTFYHIRATEAQYNRVYDIVQKALVPTPASYNYWGVFCIYCFPVSGNQTSYYCSEFVATVLRAADVLPHNSSPETFLPDDIDRVLARGSQQTGSRIAVQPEPPIASRWRR